MAKSKRGTTRRKALGPPKLSLAERTKVSRESRLRGYVAAAQMRQRLLRQRNATMRRMKVVAAENRATKAAVAERVAALAPARTNYPAGNTGQKAYNNAYKKWNVASRRRTGLREAGTRRSTRGRGVESKNTTGLANALSKL